MTEVGIRKFFGRYERFFMQSLTGGIDDEGIAEFYASEFIAASPNGVMGGKNDESLRKVMADGYAYYREIGTKSMRVRNVRLAVIDELHGVAHVGWRAIYVKGGGAEIVIDFEVHYLVQELDGRLKIFGWVSSDERELLRERGVI